MEIVIAIIITFVITTIWHNKSTKAANKNIIFVINGLISELDEIAMELKEDDFTDYLIKKKGIEYAQNFNTNVINTIKHLTNQ